MEERFTLLKRSELNDIHLKEEKKNLIKHSISIAINAACLVTGIVLKDFAPVIIGAGWGFLSVKKAMEALENMTKIKADIKSDERLELEEEKGRAL